MNRASRAVVLSMLVAVLGGCFAASRHTAAAVKLSNAGTATGFVNLTTEVDGRLQPAVVYVPREYDPSRPWPLIVFLHGAGERGRDGLAQVRVGIGPHILRHPEWFPCLVLMPQCPMDSVWGSREELLHRTARDASPHITDGIRQVREQYNIDPNRITLTGLSLGGYGTFYYGADHPDLFAALLPIAGGGREEDGPALAKMPVWVFHGGKDIVVRPEQSKSMVRAVQAAGGNIRYTEHPDAGHNSWDDTYGDENVIKWLLEQRKQ